MPVKEAYSHEYFLTRGKHSDDEFVCGVFYFVNGPNGEVYPPLSWLLIFDENLTLPTFEEKLKARKQWHGR